MKKLISIALSIIMVSALLIGCQKDTLYSLEEEKITIKSATEVDWKDVEGNSSFNEKYLSYPFYSDKEDMVTYAANAMWDIYGNITQQQGQAVWAFGTEPAFYEWVAQITNWCSNNWRKETLKAYLVDRPIMSDGYIWSWYDSPHWPNLGNTAGEHNNYHYDNNFRYIAAVENVLVWENSTDFLDVIDNKTVSIDSNVENIHVKDDVSNGMTVRDKIDAAMSFILNKLNGKNGLIIIGEVKDGNNQGMIGDFSSNYWDNIPFGYKDAYENMLFYNTLNSMANIEKMCGNVSKAQEYLDLREKVKEQFNKTFWDAKTKRYIGWIDKEGQKHDYGFTFLNTEAIYYGLADEVKVNNIYAWLKGNRIVEDDTSKGEDIYKFVIAPRVNTLAFEDVYEVVDGKKQYWWHDNHGQVNVTYNAKFGEHVENGGIIFYNSYYDLMSRIQHISADDGLNRFAAITNEFAIDELRRRPRNSAGANWVIGLIDEFAETGLVPVAYLNGFIGVEAEPDGLTICPNIPSEYTYMGVQDVVYGNNRFDIEVNKNGKVTIEAKDKVDLKIVIADYAAKGNVTVKVLNGTNIIKEQKIEAVNGKFNIDLTGCSNATSTIIIE
ncbi:MAG: hypothetical protein DBX39_06695 [Bacillota bacterium]|nr:MAG: hypothetical protein DBX39_06695 [Bacillota bacterium]